MEVTKSCIMNSRLADYGYELFFTPRYGLIKRRLGWRKILKRGSLKIEIDTEDRIIKAYTKRRGWIDYWKEVKVKRRWIKDIEKYIVLEVEVVK